MSSLVTSLKKNTGFILVLCALLIVIALFYRQPQIAMWIGFAIAGYSAIANDSIQTLGTFLASNKHRPWWILWLYVGVIMIITFFAGWYFNNGDLAYGRLESIDQPTSFSYLQLAAPVILLLLTKWKMPVSTTFLILSVFSTKSTIEGMLIKTFIGYAVAIVTAYVVWTAISMVVSRYKIDTVEEEKDHFKIWYGLQWLTTGFLWVSWLMQDIANISVYLPRAFSLEQVTAFSLFLFIIMGILFYLRGGSIQEVVTEKTDITNVMSATVVDFVYAVILIIFKQINHLPMSTTWVFLGLLAGREIALAIHSKKHSTTYQRTLLLVMKDLSRAGIGLLISILLAVLMAY